MEIHVSVPSTTPIPTFTLHFYWFEKNRIIEMPSSQFKPVTNEIQDEYNVYFKLPNIIPDKYRFYMTGSIRDFKMKLVYKSIVIYTSPMAIHNHTFQMYKYNDTSQYYVVNIPLQQFLHEEQTHKQNIYARAMRRWNYYWFNLHYFAHNYYPDVPSDTDTQQVRQLIQKMASNGIPCPRCKAHFNAYIKQHPIEPFLNSNTQLSTYLLQLHNDVNKRNHKRIFTIEEANAKYQKSNDFETKLSSICKPLYACFLDGQAQLFPDILLDQKVLETL